MAELSKKEIKQKEKEEKRNRLKYLLTQTENYKAILDKRLEKNAFQAELSNYSQVKRGIVVSTQKYQLENDINILENYIGSNKKRTFGSVLTTASVSLGLSMLLFYFMFPLLIVSVNPGLMTLIFPILIPVLSVFICLGVLLHFNKKAKKCLKFCDKYYNEMKDFRFEQPVKALTDTKIETKELPKKQYAFQDPKNRRYIFKLVFREGDEKGRNITDRAGKILNITASSMEDFVSQLKQIDFGYTIVDGVKKYNNKDIQAFVDYRNDMLNGDNPRAVDMRFVATQLWRGENSRLTSRRYDSIEDFIDACEKMKESLIGHSSHEEQNDYLKSKKEYLLAKQKELEEKFDNNQMSKETFLDETKSIERRIKKLNEEIKDNKKHRKEEIVITEGKNIHVRSRRMHTVRTINNADKPDVEDDKIME